MTTQTKRTIPEIEDAQREVERCQDEITRAEDNLTRAEERLGVILRKYGFGGPDETPVPEALPTSAVINGLQFSVIEKGQRVTDAILRDRYGEELKHWNRAPSLGELFEATGAGVTA